MRRLLWPLSLILVLVFARAASAVPYVLPDEELLVGGFGQLGGFSGSTSTLDGRIDIAGPGVQFNIALSGADNGKMGIGDPWPINPAAGLEYDSELDHFSSLAAYDSYQMTISYLSGPAGDINVAVGELVMSDAAQIGTRTIRLAPGGGGPGGSVTVVATDSISIAGRLSILPLSPELYLETLTRTGTLGLRSGIIYDALQLVGAETAQCERIYTYNLKDFNKLDPQQLLVSAP